MSVGLSRRRRPPPLHLPSIERRRKDDEDELTPLPKSPLFPTKPDAVRPTSQQALEPSVVVSTQSSSQALPSSAAATSNPSPDRATSVRRLTTVLQLSTEPSTTHRSPTRTTFVTVTQSLKSPKEKGETPEPTRTVFISAPPQVVTVTAQPGIPAPAVETLAPPKTQSQGSSPLAPGAKIPIIVLGVLGEYRMWVGTSVG